MSALPKDPLSSGRTPPSVAGNASGAAAKWALGGTVALLLLLWFVPSLMNWKLIILVGVGLIAYAGWLARQEHAWLKSAQVVPGTVAELIEVKGSRGRPSYRPRIRYTTSDGTVHDLVRPSAPGPADVAVGGPVAVAYHDATLQDLRILTFGQSYGYAACMAVLGIGLILLSTAFLAGRQFVPRIYLPGQPSSASPGR